MRQNDFQRSAACAGVLVLALITSGCSTSSINWFGSSSSEKVAATTDAAPGSGAGDDDLECPPVTVRSGASTLAMAGKSATSSDPAAMDLSYQGSIVRTARECHVAAGTMTMKVGVEGRIIVGPAGGPGQLDVPLRLAVVQEGPQAKTVLSKLVRIPVTITEGAGNVNFTHIDPDVSFPLPQPLGNIDSYVVYVGFDPNAAPVRPKATAKPKRKR
jgi:hypothetical protein